MRRDEDDPTIAAASLPDHGPASARLRARSNISRGPIIGLALRTPRKRHFLVTEATYARCKRSEIRHKHCLYLFKENTLMHVSLDPMVDTLKRAANPAGCAYGTVVRDGDLTFPILTEFLGSRRRAFRGT
ncbi:hypothetical protein ACFSQT_37555 [Mesorhizobium calcicola]|uniref:Uncharacterized protein n=1 Tax=Mesorhizobium calcicola TaxID=1300310 RepID=A0ABW4WSX5_9HYPH